MSEKATQVNHIELNHPNPNCPHDSLCPACNKGILHMRRDPKTFMLIVKDDCPCCGKMFIYKDIMQLRKILDS